MKIEFVQGGELRLAAFCFLAIHIIVRFSLLAEKMTFLMILFIKRSFFHYNIAKAIFAINLKGTEYGRSEKYSMDKDFEALFFLCGGLKVAPFDLHRGKGTCNFFLNEENSDIGASKFNTYHKNSLEF